MSVVSVVTHSLNQWMETHTTKFVERKFDVVYTGMTAGEIAPISGNVSVQKEVHDQLTENNDYPRPGATYCARSAHATTNKLECHSRL